MLRSASNGTECFESKHFFLLCQTPERQQSGKLNGEVKPLDDDDGGAGAAGRK